MPAKIFQDPARVTIRMERSDKKELEAEAEKQSIPLADLCRDRLKRRSLHWWEVKRWRH